MLKYQRLIKNLSNQKWLIKKLKSFHQKRKELELMKDSILFSKQEINIVKVIFWDIHKELIYIKRKIYQLEKYYYGLKLKKQHWGVYYAQS